MVSIPVGSITDYFGENLRAALERMLALFDDQHAGSLADHETIALLIERPASALRLVVASRQRFHRGKTADP